MTRPFGFASIGVLPLLSLLWMFGGFGGTSFAADPEKPLNLQTLQEAEAVLVRLAEEGRGELTGERIRAAIAALGDRQFKVREQAERDLRAIGHRAIPGLRQALRGEDFEIRTRAAGLLDSFEDLPARLPAELRPAIRALREDPATILPLLGALLQHPNPTVQHVVVHELRRQSQTQFGFSIHHSAKEQQAAIKQWTTWFDANADRKRKGVRGYDGAVLVNTYDGELSAYATDSFPIRAHGFPVELKKRAARPTKPLWMVRNVPARIGFALVHDTGFSTHNAPRSQQLILSDLGTKTVRGFDAPFREKWSWSIPPSDPAAKDSAKGSVYGIHPLPDGELLLGIGYSPDHAVIKLSARRKIIDTIPPPRWQPSCVVTMPLPLSPQQPKADERLVLPFERANRLIAFDKYGAVRWSRDLGAPRRVRQLPSGNLLLATRDAVLELSASGETLWEHECHDAIDALRLPDGRTAVLIAFEGLVLVDIDHVETKALDRDLRYGSLSLIPPGLFSWQR